LCRKSFQSKPNQAPPLRGSRRTDLATAVASCESWGVKKLASRAVFKGFYKNYYQHFFNSKRFLDFEFIHPKKIKLLINKE